jgi:hypothetical protein
MKGWFLIVVGVFLCSEVFAISGVSPGGYEVDFEPNLSKSFEFSFIFDDYVKSELYVSGPLSEYVTLDKEYLEGRGSVVAFLSLPAEVETPGLNVIRIGARQLAKEGGGIEIVSDVGGIIKVNVPYPGKYLELEAIAPNANAGELVNISLKAYNRGKVSLDVHPMIQIFNEVEKVETLNSSHKRVIAPFKSETFYFLLDTSDYAPGNYTATALADYGEENLARDDDPFRLGEFRVAITNYSSSFERGKIGKFNVEVESFWNSPINDLYAVVYLLDQEFVSFRTSSLSLGAWKKNTLVGFIDTTSVEEDTFMANITLYYGNATTSQVVALNLEKRIDYTPYILVFVLLVVLLGMAWRFKVFFRRVKEHRK